MSLTLGTNAVSEDLESLVHLSGIYMLGMDTEYYFFCLSMQLSVYLSIYPSVRPSIHLSIHLHHHLSITCSVSQLQLPAPWSPSPQGYAVCTLTAFLLPWSAWLTPLQDSLPPWVVLSLHGNIALLLQVALLFRAKADIRE